MAVMPIDTEEREVERLDTASSSRTHLKEIPPSREMRGIIRRECWSAASQLDRSAGIGQQVLEQIARQILCRLDLPESFVGWTMVVLASEYWRVQVAAVPHSRRLLLLPPDEGESSASPFHQLRLEANKLGLKIESTASSTAIMELLLSGSVDAIVGVASLDILEKAVDKILLVGIPALAVPLLSRDDEVPRFDADWALDMLHVGPEAISAPGNPYRELLQIARSLFEPTELARLLPRRRGGPSLAEVNGAGAAALEPLAATETIAHDFLSLGGKYARPFITIAAYDALCPRHDNGESAEKSILPDSVRKVALAIETFHKASLVHDDIEDADDYRYGRPSLHQAHGLPTAINVGDYLIGLGYSVVSRESAHLGSEVSGEILQILSDAHVRLSEGQGAELLWRDALDKQLAPGDALAIYALKTAPAFEAALLSGIRCAGSLTNLIEPLQSFCQHLGIAFQILNDLKDWKADQDNKLGLGLDALGGRPTVLWALALKELQGECRQDLLGLVDAEINSSEKISQVRELYEKAGVFDKAALLVREHQAKARDIALEIAPPRLQQLLLFLVEIVLEQPPG